MPRPAAGSVARAAWRDLAAHWRKPRPAGAALWPLWLALSVLALALVVDVGLAFDAAEAHAAQTYSRGLVVLFQIVTRFGESGWLFALSILAIVLGLWRRDAATALRARARHALFASRAFYVLAVLAFSGIASQAIKHVVGRARPRLIDQFGPWRFEFFSLKAVLASFPSGHAITVFAVAAALSFFKPRWAPLLFLLALLVSVSRLIVDAHYPSDVLGGALIGVASAVAVARVFGRRKIAFTLDGDALLPRARGKTLQA